MVTTLEEEEYPNSYHRRVAGQEGAGSHIAEPTVEIVPDVPSTPAPTVSFGPQVMAKQVSAQSELKEQHLVFQENQRGVNFDKLFGPYLVGAKRIVITDPYLRMFHQQRNLMELLEAISKVSRPKDEVVVHVVTVEDEINGDRQTENFQKIVDACAGIGIQFSWVYDRSGTQHDRDIMTDHGWLIVLSRGLDIFQRFELTEAFSFSNRMQQHRQCKGFNVTFVKSA